MANNATLVTTAKPKVSGAIYRADIGANLPTTASATLSSDFACLGYISEDGLTNANSMESESIKSWEGDTVYSAETNKEDTFKFKLIEALNVEVLKTVYGDANVSGALETGITVNANSTPQESKSWVIDTVLNDGALKRIVIPNAKVTSVADIVYKKSELVGYETTLTAVPDSAANTHYEYILKATTTGPEPEED